MDGNPEKSTEQTNYRKEKQNSSTGMRLNRKEKKRERRKKRKGRKNGMIGRSFHFARGQIDRSGFGSIEWPED